MIEQLIFLEAIALCEIGVCMLIAVERLAKREIDILNHFILGVGCGIVCFATMGEPTNVTAPLFMAAGFSAPAFIKYKLANWWEKHAGKTK